MVMQKTSLSASMNAKIIGTGDETLVLAHGYGGDQSLWEKIIPCLAEKYQVVVFDWSFVGESSYDPTKYSSFDGFADDLVGLMDEMSIKSCVFVGHSMSGMIGCIASVKRPFLFKKLILIGASPRYLNSEDYEGGFEPPEIEQLLSTIETNFQPWASGFAPLAVGGKDTLAIDKFEKTLKKMCPQVALDVAKVIFLSDNRHVLEQVNVPCTLICTTNDIVVPSSVPHYMQKRLVKSKSVIEVIDVDGHFPHLTAHVELLEVLGKALDS
ncbi:strigolactone esterase D14 [Silene latifolia]|uniref:strigolactone esterase D14 n=1 Tax=Silene latifolia TaxID=37657 RepID=UPI003D778829